MFNGLKLTTVIVLLAVSSVASASNYRLDFGGSFLYLGTDPGSPNPLDTPIEVTGSFLFSPLPNTPPFISDGNTALYGNHPIEGQLVVGGEIYTMTSSPLNNFGIGDDNPSGGPDLFGFSYSFVDAVGESIFLGLNMYFTDSDIVNGFAYPEFFDQDDLVPFDLAGGTTSGILASGIASQALLGAFDTVHFRQVPIPASLWLFVTALGGLRLSSLYSRKFVLS